MPQLCRKVGHSVLVLIVLALVFRGRLDREGLELVPELFELQVRTIPRRWMNPQGSLIGYLEYFSASFSQFLA